MKKNLCIYSAIFLLIGSNYSNVTPTFASAYSSNVDNYEIEIDYLDQLPKYDYILDSGDSFSVNISIALPELKSFVTVDGEGTIYLPRLKRIFVKGLSINELSAVLNKAYKKYVKDPSTEILMVNYRPLRIFVEGEVSNPGMHIMEGSMTTLPDKVFKEQNEVIKNKSFPEIKESSIAESINYNSQTNYFPTVMDAIRASGGITEYSNLSEVRVIRKNNLSKGDDKITTLLNLEKLLIDGDNTQNIRIYDSDIIKIKKANNSNRSLLRKGILSNLNPRYISVFVAGRVKIPGDTVLSRASVLSDAIDISGGAKVIRGPLTFIRFNNDGTIDKRNFNYRRRSKRGSYKNPTLKNGDLIVVGDSLLSTTFEVISDFTSPFVGIYSTYGVIKAIEF